MSVCTASSSALIAHTSQFGDGDIVGLTVSLVDGGDDQDPIGIDLEGDLAFCDTFRSRGNISKREMAEQIVVLDVFMLALVYFD